MRFRVCILISIILLFIMSGCNSGNSNANLTVVNGNKGIEYKGVDKSEEGDWLAFGNPEDDHRIYKMKTDGSHVTKISNKKIEGIVQLEDYIYYKDSDTLYESGPIRRVSNDGLTDEGIINEAVEDFVVTQDNIIFIKEEKIYISDKEGNHKKDLVIVKEKVFSIKYDDGTIYFNTNRGIYSVQEDGTQLKLIIPGGFYKFRVYNNQLIYNDNGQIKIYNLETQEEKDFVRQNNYELFVYDGYLYYTESDYLIRENIYTNNTDRVAKNTFIYDFFGYKDDIYFFGNNFIWKMDKELKNKEIIFGKGSLTNHNMLLVNDNHTLVRSYDFSNYTHDITYLYQETEDGMEKIMSHPIDNALIVEDDIFYVDNRDKKLYRYNLETQNQALIINENILEFQISDDTIYFTTHHDYKLYKYENETIEIIINEPVYNLQLYKDTLYYLKRNANNHLYRYKKDETEELLLETFVTQYKIIDDKIYYIDESDNYKLFLYDGEEKMEIVNEKVSRLYKSNDVLYYVTTDGIHILNQLDTKTQSSQVIKFIGLNYLDFYIKEDRYVEAITSESGNVTVKEAIYKEELGLYYDNDLYYKAVDDTKYICYYDNYIYLYNNEEGTLELLHSDPISEFQVEKNEIYVTGYKYNDELRSYIKRINIDNKTKEYIVESEERYTPAYNFIVEDSILYYHLPYKEHKHQLYKYDSKENSIEVIAQDCNKILDINRNQIIYQNEDEYIVKMNTNGSNKKILVEESVEYIGMNDNDIYYFRYTNDNMEGHIMKKNLSSEVISNITNGAIKTWDYYIYNNTLYYLVKNIKSMDLETEKELTFLENEDIRHFYIYNKELIAYLNNEGGVLKKLLSD
ncbi:uncharacterized protein DUF5050 [Natranaerovirga hydrolytica]|uniref:Uncharacterized protein DUF5050 n=1 Tax=Natranaerovirga hydrolytica TaxID=680378 RepID=A0A4R1MFW3_9FIRM|nr:DUF5050 domain-containing protein [Natranaerovirga hydrolytica]TCK89019.1 uncharacterized protein DUF5050 [Natranaerovirga hydrolytica]